MKQTLIKLDWDSELFNCNVGRIEGLIQNEQDIRNIELLITENNSKLTYYSTPNKLPSDASQSKKYKLVLVDKKTTYKKRINSDIVIPKSITSIKQNTIHENKLIDLAIQSGIYSRFNVDKRIRKEKFEEMYRFWMINSLSRKIAKEVLVLKKKMK